MEGLAWGPTAGESWSWESELRHYTQRDMSLLFPMLLAKLTASTCTPWTVGLSLLP